MTNPVVFILLAVLCASLSARAAEPQNISDPLLFVGTYTNAASKGIYAFGMRAGELVPLGLAADTTNPAFLAIDPKRRLLFAVNEVRDGAVSAFAIDDRSGKLKLLNQQSTKGRSPCHLALDKDARNIIVANYGTGSVAVFPIAEDGKLKEMSDFHQHQGHSVNRQRQEGPHAHCVTFDPSGRFVYVCDLGLDKVMIYRFDPAQGKLTPNDPPFAALAPGAGPRHMVFGASGKFAYVVNEMGCTVTVFAFDAATGALIRLQDLSTLPGNFRGESTCAEIAVSPNGKSLYASNRGADSIAVFRIDPATGILVKIQDQTSGGKGPRHFAVEPSGDLMICNQTTGDICTAPVDLEGRVQTPHIAAKVSAPVCAVVLPERSNSKSS